MLILDDRPLVRFLLAVALLAYGAYAVWRLKPLRSASHRRPMPDLGIIDRAEHLRRTDPAAADRMLDEECEKVAAQEEALRTDLRQRAQSERDAAEQLRKLLRDDAETHAFAKKEMHKHHDPGFDQALRDIEAAAHATDRELATLEAAMREKGWLR